MDVIWGVVLFSFGGDRYNIALIWVKRYQPVQSDSLRVGLKLSEISLCRDGSVQQAIIRKQSGP